MRLVLPGEIASGRGAGGPMELAAGLERLLAGGERAAEELPKRAPASSHHPQEQASVAEKAKVHCVESVSYAATTKTKSFESTASRHKHSRATVRQSDSKHMAPNSRQSRRQRQQQVLANNIDEDASKLLLQQHLQNLSNHFRAPQPHHLRQVSSSPSAPTAVSSFLESLQSGQQALAASSSSFTAASVSHHQHQSPSLHGFMSAAALAAARQHQQQRQELLSQFASLHSLSAVASAIQQQQQQQSQQHLGLTRQPQAASFMNGTACGSPVAPNHHFGGNSAAFNQVHQYNLAEQLARSLVHNHVPLSGLTQTPAAPMDPQRLASQQPSGFIAAPPLTRLPQAAPSTAFECLQAASRARPSPGQAGPQRRRTGKRRGARKCRKIYGMAQRQMWCTQCKWKKACSRFFGLNHLNHQSHHIHQSQQVVSSTSSVTTAIAEESRHGSSVPSTKAEAERH